MAMYLHILQADRKGASIGTTLIGGIARLRGLLLFVGLNLGLDNRDRLQDA